MPDPTHPTHPTAAHAGALLAAMLAAALLLTAGCAAQHHSVSSSASTAGSSAPTTAEPDRAPDTQGVASAHGSAAGLAAQIPGCTPQPVSAPAAARRLGLTGPARADTAAACTLRGRTAIILTFATAANQAATDTQLAALVAYYATGSGWSAAPTDTSEPVGQQSVVQGIAIALHGSIATGNH